MPCYKHNNAFKFIKYVAPFKICFDQKIEVVVAKIPRPADNIPRKHVKLKYLLTAAFHNLPFFIATAS